MTSTSERFGREDWTRHTPKQKARRFGTFAVCAAVIAWTLSSIEVVWAWVWDSPEQMGDLFSRMYPPDPTNLGAILQVLLETVNIATIATAIAVSCRCLWPTSPRRTPRPTVRRFGSGG